MKKLLSDFAKNTTGHGWGNIQQRKSMCTKVAWLLFCVACTVASIGHVTSIIYRYSLFETKDKLLVENQDLVFPSVTVCPLTQFSKESSIRFTEDYTNGGEPTVDSVVVLQFLLSSFYSFGENSTLLDAASSEIQRFYKEFYDQMYTYRSFYENVPSITEYSHQKRGFISSCVYQGKSCSDEYVDTFVHYHYYNCFTFNGANTTLSLPNSNTTGPTGGLSMQLFLDTDKNLYTIYNPDYPTSGNQGVKVVIHEKGTLPDLENDGFEIEFGRSINVALSANRRELMKPPWGECADPPQSDEGGYTYSKKVCQMRCLQKMVHKSCGCKRGSLPMYPAIANVNYCLKIKFNEWNKSNPNETVLLDDLEKLGCSLKEHSWEDVLDQDDCQCRDKCSYHTYDMTLSQSQWPKRGVELDFYCRRIARLPNYINSSVYKAFHLQMDPFCTNVYQAYADGWLAVQETIGNSLRENFLRLNVYFKDLETKVTKQEAEFSLGSMISEIGGSLGIFIGVSIITIVEVFILCLSIIRLLTKMSKTFPQDESLANEQNAKPWP